MWPERAALCSAYPGQRPGPMHRSGDENDRAFGADDQGSAFGVGTDGVQFNVQLFFGADAGWIGGWAEVEDEVLADRFSDNRTLGALRREISTGAG